MNRPVNPEMLLLARESRGLTQTELAMRLQVTQAMISKAEKLPGKVSDVLLEALANELGYPVTFFYQPGYRYAPVSFLHRKQAGLQQKIRNKIEAEANIILLHLHQLLDSVELPQQSVPQYSTDDFQDGVEGVARAVRTSMRLPRGPLDNMTILLENMGIVLVPCAFETDKLDGFTIITEECPVIFFNNSMPWCRIRFSLAHELGHIVLNHVQRNGIEEEANAFASALLMPRDDISRVFNGEKIDLELLAALKPRWKVSIQALLWRASALGFLEKYQSEYLWRQLSAAGYRKREPANLDIPKERPSTLNRIIELHLNELGYTEGELIEVLCTQADSFYSLYPAFAPSRPKLKVLRRVK